MQASTIVRLIAFLFAGLSLGLLGFAAVAATAPDRVAAVAAAATLGLASAATFSLIENARLALETRRLADHTKEATELARAELEATVQPHLDVDWRHGTKTGTGVAMIYGEVVVANAGPGGAFDLRVCLREETAAGVWWWSSEDPFGLSTGEKRTFKNVTVSAEDGRQRHSRLFSDLVGGGPGPDWAIAYKDALGRSWRASSRRGVERWAD